MSFESWGLYPKTKNTELKYNTLSDLINLVQHNKDFIPYGNGRSYGDSALANKVISMRKLNEIISFDEVNGIIAVQSGILLSEILDCIVPKGWFLAITPGTKLITVGGAIASDVHGKNHHIDGCFSNCVISFELLLPNGTMVQCSNLINKTLFEHTCGGQGLTGLIIKATLQLKKINSSKISQTTIKTKSLKETFDVFNEIKHEPYSVAWIDCMAKGNNLGRSHVMYGDFVSDGDLKIRSGLKLSVPFFLPNFVLNSFTVKLFNILYYNRIMAKTVTTIVDFNTFFYPLDKINNWNKIYGKNGFLQYQFILPLDESYVGIEEVLKILSSSGKASFLAVLKLYGKENGNTLSFPMEGFSLALDLKITKEVFELLDKLDTIVTNLGGRVYLSKDARLSRESFDRTYSKSNEFRYFRSSKGLEIINSYQSRRLGI